MSFCNGLAFLRWRFLSCKVDPTVRRKLTQIPHYIGLKKSACVTPPTILRLCFYCNVWKGVQKKPVIDLVVLTSLFFLYSCFQFPPLYRLKPRVLSIGTITWWISCWNVSNMLLKKYTMMNLFKRWIYLNSRSITDIGEEEKRAPTLDFDRSHYFFPNDSIW